MKSNLAVAVTGPELSVVPAMAGSDSPTAVEIHLTEMAAEGVTESITESANAEQLHPRPAIYLEAGEMHDVLLKMEVILAESGRFFQRGGQIVEVRLSENRMDCDVKVMNPDMLVVAFAELSQWFRKDNRTGNWSVCDPQARHCTLLLGKGHYSHLPVLSGVSSQPHIRPDGSLCLSPGYDAATGIYSVFDGGVIPVDALPDKEAARIALRSIEELLGEVAFADPRDQSAAVAAILTAAVRPSLNHAPMFHVLAHQPGSGKSYLCQLIAAFAGSKPSSQATFPATNDECGKLLLAQLIKAPVVIEFDNLTTDIKPHDKLCTVLTGEQIEGRLLGTSSTVALSTRVLFLSSGNNVRPFGDMLRRTIVIHLDPRIETPSARAFARPDLLAELRRDRTRYVAMALTIVQAWLASGEPRPEIRPVASFGQWSRWCREALMWLGYEDPAASLFDGLDRDPEKVLLGRVLQGWHDRFGSKVVMVREIVGKSHILHADDDLLDALIEASNGSDSVNVRKLGHWLARQEGRIVQGLRLQKAPKTRSAQNWQVEPVA